MSAGSYYVLAYYVNSKLTPGMCAQNCLCARQHYVAYCIHVLYAIP